MAERATSKRAEVVKTFKVSQEQKALRSNYWIGLITALLTKSVFVVPTVEGSIQLLINPGLEFILQFGESIAVISIHEKFIVIKSQDLMKLKEQVEKQRIYVRKNGVKTKKFIQLIPTDEDGEFKIYSTDRRKHTPKQSDHQRDKQ